LSLRGLHGGKGLCRLWTGNNFMQFWLKKSARKIFFLTKLLRAFIFSKEAPGYARIRQDSLVGCDGIRWSDKVGSLYQFERIRQFLLISGFFRISWQKPCLQCLNPGLPERLVIIQLGVINHRNCLYLPRSLPRVISAEA